MYDHFQTNHWKLGKSDLHQVADGLPLLCFKDWFGIDSKIITNKKQTMYPFFKKSIKKIKVLRLDTDIL